MSIENIRRIKAEVGIPKQKAKYVIPKKSAKKIKQEKALANDDNAVDDWFEYFMQTCEPVCQECGMRADWLKEPKYATLWRACQAHILPKKKSKFPSLAANRNNHLVLFPAWGGWLCGCHDEYDSSWDNASKMNVWNLVKEVFVNNLNQVILSSERKNIPQVLMNYINTDL